MVTKMCVGKKRLFWDFLGKQNSWTFIWTFFSCVKMVFFSLVFGPFFLSINVGTPIAKTILTQRAEVCQNFSEDFPPYKNVGQKMPKKSPKKHDFDTAQKREILLSMNVGIKKGFLLNIFPKINQDLSFKKKVKNKTRVNFFKMDKNKNVQNRFYTNYLFFPCFFKNEN